MEQLTSSLFYLNFVLGASYDVVSEYVCVCVCVYVSLCM